MRKRQSGLTAPPFSHVNPHAEDSSYRRKPLLYGTVGKILAIIYSIGAGVILAASLYPLVPWIGLYYCLAAIFGLATTYANYRMSNQNVIEVISNGIVKLFNLKKQDHFFARFFFLIVGSILSLALAIMLAALTYSSVIDLVSAFSILTSVAWLLPPVGIVLGAATFICLFSIFLKAFRDIAIDKHPWLAIKHSLKRLYGMDNKNDANKTLLQFIKQKPWRFVLGLFATALVVASFGLMLWGQHYILQRCGISFNNILSQLFQTHATVLASISFVFANVLALVAQVPFMLKVIIRPVTYVVADTPPSLHSTRLTAETEQKLSPKRSLIHSVALLVASVISAAASGIIAISGQEVSIGMVLAGAGACLNTFLGAVGNNMKSTHPSKSSAKHSDSDSNDENDLLLSAQTTPLHAIKLTPQHHHKADNLSMVDVLSHNCIQMQSMQPKNR